MKIIIIGGGPGGYVAAIRAAQLGADVTVIEKSGLGGVCLNSGCIPTKALLASAGSLQHCRDAPGFGVKIENISYDFPSIMRRKDKIVEQLRGGIDFLFRKNKITLVRGEGEVLSPNKVKIKREDGSRLEISADNLILAVGSMAKKPRDFHINGKTIITSEGALSLERPPASIIIIGSGTIGVEFASIFNAFGVEVTLLEELGQILPAEDEEISRRLEKSLTGRGINILTGVRVKEVLDSGGQVRVELTNGKNLESQKVLAAVGRAPDTKAEFFKNLNLLDSRGFITNEGMKTTLAGVYAVGDAAGEPLLAHKASKEGVIAAENIFGSDSSVNYDAIPSCTFGMPQVASVGLTETRAREKGLAIDVGKFPFQALGRAHADGETGGMVKVIAEKSGKLLGVHIIGKHAAELIAEAALGLQIGITARKFEKTIHAHPTFSEALGEAAGAVFGKAIHI